MRIFFGVIFVIICVFVAYKLSDKYTLRKKFYTSFLAFAKRLKNEVAFSKKTILSLIKEQSINDDLFYKMLNERFTTGKKVFDGKIFSSDEILFINDFFEEMGKTNGGLQYDFLSLTEKELTEKLSVVQDEEKKYKSLYIKLGFLLGLLIFVLII